MSSKHLEDWIATDLDGTLAFYDQWVSWDTIGPAIPLMLERVKRWVAEGQQVKIFTARVSYAEDQCHVTGKVFYRAEVVRRIQDWCEANGLPRLEVTHEKDVHMIELWDDRAIQVIPNTGRTLADEHQAELVALQGKP